jgi:hypothetical protein
VLNGVYDTVQALIPTTMGTPRTSREKLEAAIRDDNEAFIQAQTVRQSVCPPHLLPLVDCSMHSRVRVCVARNANAEAPRRHDQQMRKDEDEHLDHLERGLGKLGEMSLTIRDELEDQDEYVFPSPLPLVVVVNRSHGECGH